MNLNRRLAALDAARLKAERADAAAYVASITPLERDALIEVLAAAKGKGVQWRGDDACERAYTHACTLVGHADPPDRRGLDAALALVEVVRARGFTTWARLFVEGKVNR